MEDTLRPDILVIGDANIDYLGNIPYIPAPDEEVAINPLNSYLGGSGVNFAVATKRLGLEAVIYSAVGNDGIGHGLLKSISEQGLAIDKIKVVEDIPSGMVFGLIEPDGVRRLFCYRGANLALCPQDIPDDMIGSSRWLHLNGPVYELAFDVLRRAKHKKVPTSLDPGSILIEEHNIDELLPLSDIVFLNEVEFIKLSKGETLLERAAFLHGKGAEWVVLKHGSSGSVLFRKGQPAILQGAFEIDPVDSTGAGDAFNAGFIFGVLNKEDLSMGLIFANAVGALTTRSVGATTGLPSSINEVEEFITHTKQKKCDLSLS